MNHLLRLESALDKSIKRHKRKAQKRALSKGRGIGKGGLGKAPYRKGPLS